LDTPTQNRVENREELVWHTKGVVALWVGAEIPLFASVKCQFLLSFAVAV